MYFRHFQFFEKLEEDEKVKIFPRETAGEFPTPWERLAERRKPGLEGEVGKGKAKITTWHALLNRLLVNRVFSLFVWLVFKRRKRWSKRERETIHKIKRKGGSAESNYFVVGKLTISPFACCWSLPRSFKNKVRDRQKKKRWVWEGRGEGLA